MLKNIVGSFKFYNKIRIVNFNPSKRLFSSKERILLNSRTTLIKTSIIGLSGYLLYNEILNPVKCEVAATKEPQLIKKHEMFRDDLPYYSDRDIAAHDNKYHILKNPGVDTFDVIGNSWEIEREKGVWITYGVGVYDITSMIDKHGNPSVSILLCAGMALDPFWEDQNMKKLHEKQWILDMLEKSRIGNLIKNED